MEIKMRSRRNADQSFMQEMLYQAIFVPDGTLPERSMIQDPKLYRYVDAWKAEELSIIAEIDGLAVGACWLKWFDKSNPGYGFVREDIPEMSIAILPEYRGQGIGTKLIRAILERLPEELEGVSLSVDTRNPAMGLYMRMGFHLVHQKDHSAVMLWEK